jgi:hypothetical protein
MLPLYTFLVCVLLKEGGRERKGERESKNKQTYLLCFLKKGEERERGGGESRKERGALASPFTSIFETDYPCDLQDP